MAFILTILFAGFFITNKFMRGDLKNWFYITSPVTLAYLFGGLWGFWPINKDAIGILALLIVITLLEPLMARIENATKPK